MSTFLHEYWLEIISLLVTIFGSFHLENKFNIINRYRRRVAKFKNEEAEISMILQYKPKADINFEDIKKTFKKQFRSERDFKVIRESAISLDLKYGLFSLTVLQNQEGNIY